MQPHFWAQQKMIIFITIKCIIVVWLERARCYTLCLYVEILDIIAKRAIICIFICFLYERVVRQFFGNDSWTYAFPRGSGWILIYVLKGSGIRDKCVVLCQIFDQKFLFTFLVVYNNGAKWLFYRLLNSRGHFFMR